MKIKISEDFSDTPGARYRSDGKYSGEEFYEDILKPNLDIVIQDNEVLLIDFDDCYGFASAWLSEVFYRATLDFGSANLSKFLRLKSDDEPLLIEQIKRYIQGRDNNQE